MFDFNHQLLFSSHDKEVPVEERNGETQEEEQQAGEGGEEEEGEAADEDEEVEETDEVTPTIPAPIINSFSLFKCEGLDVG